MFDWVLNTLLKPGIKNSNLEQRITHNKITFKVMHSNEIIILEKFEKYKFFLKVQKSTYHRVCFHSARYQ